MDLIIAAIIIIAYELYRENHYTKKQREIFQEQCENSRICREISERYKK